MLRITGNMNRLSGPSIFPAVEETLNALVDAEAHRRANGETRPPADQGGEVRRRVPKLRQRTFETAIIERYRRRESSVEQALIDTQTTQKAQKPPGPRLSNSNLRHGHHDFPELMESLESMMVRLTRRPSKS
jgi:mutator family transposase